MNKFPVLQIVRTPEGRYGQVQGWRDDRDGQQVFVWVFGHDRPVRYAADTLTPMQSPLQIMADEARRLRAEKAREGGQNA